VTRASIDGRALAPDAIGPELPFLRELSGWRSFAGHLEIDLGFGRHDTDVQALYIGRLTSHEPLTLTVSLADEFGRQTLRRSLQIPAGGVSVFERFDAPARARAASITIDTASANKVTITDLRLEGQSQALRDYVRRTLRFPAS
jgi:hypothetical protein